VHESSAGLKEIYPDAFNGSSLTNINGDKTLYPVFKATRKTYTVTFINPTAPVGSQVLAKISTPYGESADYTGAGYPEPTRLDVANSSLYEFAGWEPKPEKITGDLPCEAQFAFLDDKWYTALLGDFGEYEDAHGNRYPGHKLDNNTIHLLKYNNYGNPAVAIPD
jgi:hypothetical protein